MQVITDPFSSNSSSDDKEPLFSQNSIGCSSQLSSVPETNVSLDALSPFESSAVTSVLANPDTEGGSMSRPPRKKRLVQVKAEK